MVVMMMIVTKVSKTPKKSKSEFIKSESTEPNKGEEFLLTVNALFPTKRPDPKRSVTTKF